jgi:hypothetical protein
MLVQRLSTRQDTLISARMIPVSRDLDERTSPALPSLCRPRQQMFNYLSRSPRLAAACSHSRPPGRVVRGMTTSLITEQLRQPPTTPTPADAHEAQMLLGYSAMVSTRPETQRPPIAICTKGDAYRNPDRHWCDQCQNGDRERDHQEHQTHWPTILDRRRPQGPCARNRPESNAVHLSSRATLVRRQLTTCRRLHRKLQLSPGLHASQVRSQRTRLSLPRAANLRKVRSERTPRASPHEHDSLRLTPSTSPRPQVRPPCRAARRGSGARQPDAAGRVPCRRR